MMERFNDLKEMLAEETSSLAVEHPTAVSIACGLIGLVIGIPICVASYKMMGKAAGKATAKELIKAGVWLGPTHP